MTHVVNLFAGPGAGKSTMAAGLFYKLKTRGINCEMAREYAKDVVWEGREHLLAQQIYIFAKQLKRMKDLDGKVDVIITDSPLLMSNIYGGAESKSFQALVVEEFNRFNNLNFIVVRMKPYVQAGRLQNYSTACHLDQVIEDYLNMLRVQTGYVADDALDWLESFVVRATGHG